MAARRVAAIALISLPIFGSSGGRAIGRTACHHRHRQPHRSPRRSPRTHPGPRDTAPDTPFDAAPPAPTPDLYQGTLPIVTDQFATVTVMPRGEIDRRHRPDARRNPAGKARHHLLGLCAGRIVTPDHPRSRQLSGAHPGERHRLERRFGTRRRSRRADRSAGGTDGGGHPRAGDVALWLAGDRRRGQCARITGSRPPSRARSRRRGSRRHHHRRPGP